MAAHRGHLLLMTGVLGGFTTFSTAMLDVFVLWRQDKKVSAAFTLVVTPIAAILAVIPLFLRRCCAARSSTTMMRTQQVWALTARHSFIDR